MNPESISLESLEDQVRTLSVAETPAEVFKTLLESARLAAPRSTVYLVRQGQTKGWGAVGYPADAAARQREHLGPADSGWFGEIVRSEPALQSSTDGSQIPDFGQPRPFECVGIAVRLKGRAIALLVAERQEGEYPWFPPILSILVRVAQLRLDLDLARRKMAPGRAAVAAAPSAPPSRPPEPAALPHTPPAAVATPPEVARPADTPAAPALAAPTTVAAAESREIGSIAVTEFPDEAPAPSTDESGDPRLDAARRYARLVATDIRLYNEEAVLLGRKHGDLSNRLRESLLRGKETFLRRHSDLGSAGSRILYDAYVQVLAAGQGELLPPDALET